MKIVVDAMGGDYAPQVVIEGSIQALREYDLEIILVGREKEIKKLLPKNYPQDRLSIVNADEVISMSEPPALSIRRKRSSSIVVGIELLKENKAEAFVSAGNTGAVVCAATLSLGLLKGIERPGISVVVPTLNGISLIIDVGANIDPKPEHLLQYGIMAKLYAQNILKIPKPKVGILNIGEEETKGPEFMRLTHELFSKSNLNFIGNIEAKDIFTGKADIIVCDGFVGNIALKVSEGLAETLQEFLKRYLLSNLLGRLSLILALPSLKKFKKQIDYAEYGGAPLLGVDGVVIIAHGRSNARAIKNAIRVARQEVENRFNEKILEVIKA